MFQFHLKTDLLVHENILQKGEAMNMAYFENDDIYPTFHCLQSSLNSRTKMRKMENMPILRTLQEFLDTTITLRSPGEKHRFSTVWFKKS